MAGGPKGQTDLEFRFVEELPEIQNYIRLSPCLVGQKGFRVENGGFRYQVDPDPKGAKVFVGPGGWTPKAPATLHKMRHWNFLSPVEERAKNFVYNVFDYLTQIVQMPLGQSYVHASSMEKDGEGIVISAWGGIGKTTTMIKLVTEDGWNFLSDDLTLVSKRNIVYPVPKKLQVYAYNLEGQENLRRRLLRGRSLVDRASWEYHRRVKGPSGARRRVSSDFFLGETSLGKAAKIRKVIHLERHDQNEFIVHKIPLEDLINRCAHTIVDELSPFTKISSAMNSTDSNEWMPTVCSLQDGVKRIYREAFGGANLYLVRVPLKAGPEELVGKVRGILE